MLRRLPRVRLRLAHVTLRLLVRARHDQAHRRRTLAVPRVALLMPAVAVAVLVLALQPANTTRATKPWTWAPLPATAFGSLPIGEPSIRSSEDERADDRSQRTAPSRSAEPAVPTVQGAERPTASPSTGTGAVGPEGSTARPRAVSGATVTVRGNGPDGLSFSAVVTATPTPVPTPDGPIHVVASGDNLWTIARRHSAELAPILRWNEGVDPDRLVAGQRILVPGGSKMRPLPQPTPLKPRTASVRPATVDRPAAPRVPDGDHLWPLPIRGDLTRGFSAAHPAIDIAAPQGTRVRAIAGGTVVWSGWKNNGGGYVVEIEHPDGMRSTYNHNSKLTVERGDTVDQGDTIALVGSTGNSTGPHLDLRIRMGGRLVDPLRFY